jgi:hypothetical protein
MSCWVANVNGDDQLTTADGFHFLNYLGAGPGLNCQPCEYRKYPGTSPLRVPVIRDYGSTRFQ